MMKKIVIFDIGATLVFGPGQGPASRIAAGLSLSTSQKNMLQNALMTRNWENSERVMEFLDSEFRISERTAKSIVNDVWTAQHNDASPIMGVHSVLSRIVEAGMQLAIISNIWHPFLLSVRRSLGPFIDKNIPPDFQFFSYREGTAKPAKAIFRRALDAVQAEPHQAVMVGDSYREDIEAAMDLGLSTVWLLHRPAAELWNLQRILNGDAPPPSHTLKSVLDLHPEVLRTLLTKRRLQAKQPESA